MIFRTLALSAAVGVFLAAGVAARAPVVRPDGPAASTSVSPAWCTANHDVGRVGFAVSNDGTLGLYASGGRDRDCFTNEPITSGDFPRGHGTMYFYGGTLWIGAVVGSDTLVSTGSDGWSVAGNELHPDFEEAGGGIGYTSIAFPNPSGSPRAFSEQDFIAVYRDTCHTCRGVSRDVVDNRDHIPLNVEVTQRSMAWSYAVAEDFILLDYAIRNIGEVPLTDVFVGLLMDHDASDADALYYLGATDDIVGLWKGTVTSSRATGCEVPIDVEMPWIADNDGDLGANPSEFSPVPHVAGTRILRQPVDGQPATFNWWASSANPACDWGPMRRAGYRDFGTGGSGTPIGDRNKYFVLSNGDQDFDVLRMASIGQMDSIWLPPSPYSFACTEIMFDARYLLSSGGFDLGPGESAAFTVAFVCGDNLHTDPLNLEHLPDDPDLYYEGLDFTDFLNNGLWAGWVYDNPGVDTDSDGYCGAYRLCGDDTLWYEGDGVADFCAATPPVPPHVRLEPLENGIRVHWNGHPCETQKDWATRKTHFEGYQVYISTDSTTAGFARIGSYDIDDYHRYYWDFACSDWRSSSDRFTLQDARCRYAPSGCTDATWHPMDYPREAPYVMPGYSDSIFYFRPILANACLYGLETPVTRSFPDAPPPPYRRPQDVPLDSIGFYLTDEGGFKHYEYEMTIDGLVPGREYWVSVTSTAYASLLSGAEPLESAVAQNSHSARPTGFCCLGMRGNANCDDLDEVSLADVSTLIDFLFVDGSPICCPAEADLNQSGGPTPTAADISLADIMILIDYLFITGPTLDIPACD